MKRFLSVILCISILFSTCAVSFAVDITASETAVLQENTLSAKEIKEQEELKLQYEMFKAQQEISTLSDGNKVVYDGTFEEYEKEYEEIKKQGNQKNGRTFGKTKKSKTEDGAEKSSVSTFAASSSSPESIYDTLIKPAFLNGINHPHLSGRNNSEYISTFDGTLSLNFTDVVLPGKNGLDLNLGRYYKSEQSFVDTYSGYEYVYTKPTTYLNKRFALGLGWGLSIPSVEVYEDEQGIIQATYHDGTGASYRSNYNDADRNDNGDYENNGYYIYSSCLDNYPNDNVRFKEKDRSYSRNGMRSYFSFTNENNTKEYFTRTGEIMAIVDRFGNEITFDYEYIRGENLIPFNSIYGNALGNFSLGTGFSVNNNNSSAIFNGGTSGKKGTLKSYSVELDTNYDEYYVSMLYQVASGLSAFSGDFELYCDLYSEDDDLLVSKLIQTVTPDGTDEVFCIDGEFSISELNLDEVPTQARLRVEADGKKEIYFAQFRLSPKNPLISKITDTIGRTVEFTYGADCYDWYDEDETPNYNILVEITAPDGTLMRTMWYYRNIYTYDSTFEEEPIGEDRFYLFWGAYNGEYTSSVDYVWKDGSLSNATWQWTRGYSVDYYGRPYVSVVYNRNSKTCYEYESVWKLLATTWKQKSASRYTTGYVITHRVVKRYDVNDNVDSETGTNPQINVKTFNYTSGLYDDETGYNCRQYSGAYPGFLDPDEGVYKVVVTNPSGSIETYEYTTHTFDEGFRRIWEIELPLLDKHTLQEDSSSSASDKVVTEYTYTDNYALTSPTKVKVTETIDSQSRTYYTVNEYDHDSCLPEMTTLPLTESEVAAVPAYKKVYTEYQKISDRFFVPVLNKYYQSADGTQLTTSTVYDSVGRPVSQTDEAGNIVYTEYNEEHPWLVSRVWYSDPENIGEEDRISEVQYLYEDTYLLGPTKTRTKYADNKYSETSATYDGKYGGILTSSDAKGNTTTYLYDSLGRVSEIRYPGYRASGQNKYVREKFTYSLYETFNNTYYLGITKNVYDSTSATSSGSKVSTEVCKYDDYGNQVYRKSDIGEEEYIYDSCNRAVSYKNYNDFGTDNISASCTYDNLNRITSSTDKLGNSSHAEYKLLSNEFYLTPAGTTTQENHSKEYYDMYGNIIKTAVYPGGITSSPVESTFTYDLAGNVLTSTDGNGNTTTFEYDVLGNNIKMVRADGSTVENQFTKWGTSSKTTVIDGNNRYSSNSDYEDDRGLSTSIYSTGLDINTKPWYNEYDANGSLLKTTAPNANITNYEYDNSGNIRLITDGFHKTYFDYIFDGQISGKSKRNGYDLVEDVSYYYDSYERPVSKTYEVLVPAPEGENYEMSETRTVLYSYNKLSSITSVTSPAGFKTNYTLDEAERVTDVGFDGKEISYEYYGDGMIKKITYPNSMTTEYSYDNANRVTSILTKLSGNVLRSYSYTYDGNGNVLTVSGSENVTYTYDALNRLASSTKNGVTTTYSYDSRNNLVSETDGTNTKTYEYGGDNRLHKVTENGVETIYEYDLNGNLIGRGEDVFAYDENNRMLYSKVDGVETTFEIGAEDLRRKKTVDGNTTTYWYNENGYVLTEDYHEIIYGNTALAKKSGTSYYYYLYNAHGDVTAIVNEAGEIVNSYEYDPWGKITSQSETVANNIKYSGEYYDTETGLIYLRNRYYDPNARRFTTEDPARDDLNWYCYCGNNPVNFVDPWGLEYLVVSGGAYNTNGGYEFIETAIKKIKEWIDLGDNENITWIIADEGWSRNDKNAFQSLVDSLNSYVDNTISLKMISHKDELINYINNKSGGNSRANDKIEKFALFSHGWDGTISLGYNYSIYNTNLDLKTSDISKISGSAFDNPNSAFYSCNTGTSGSSSFAQKWVNQVSGKTWAFVGKSEYTYMNSGESWESKVSRFNFGFSFYGSANYPIGATSIVTFGPWKGSSPFMTSFTRRRR